jgi:hypothetical protein
VKSSPLRDQLDSAFASQAERAIAVEEFELLGPGRPFRQFRNRQAQHRLDEAGRLHFIALGCKMSCFNEPKQVARDCLFLKHLKEMIYS